MANKSIGDQFKDAEMDKSGTFTRVMVILLFLAAPAVTLRIISTLFDAPHLQPLALTRENVTAAELSGGFSRIDVHVTWGSDWQGTMTRAQLRDRISKTLKPQTDFFRIHFQDLPGEYIDIIFAVGSNNYGPYSPGEMALGIKSALVAVRMANRPEG